MPSSSWSWKSPTSKWSWSSEKGLKQWTEGGGSESGTVVPAHQPPPQQDHQPSNSASPPMSDMPPFGWLSAEARDAMIVCLFKFLLPNWVKRMALSFVMGHGQNLNICTGFP